ncbi:Alcohol dehydrogenase patD [Colletotrichum trifolii]|uniref:Alcohol dehydrogenase patD n=1 Tax=Colletotrichum trifolii TaxID=5466 RepID=A0A4R8QLP8_COLTR|nr:Alcohol dehydrogenase patD [Colletotrichum trifolii]
MSSLPKTYKAAVVESKGAELKIVEKELQKPGPGHILVKVLACGVCHSDTAMQAGDFGEVFPRVPGHEVIGDVAAVGENVSRFSGGERVGGAWHGGWSFSMHNQRFTAVQSGLKLTYGVGHDGTCRQCQKGMFQTCSNGAVNGVSRDGGYAEYVLLRAEAAVRVPKDVDPADAAPLLCAGVTVFNSIRKMGVEHGSLVAIQGLGGLGHLGVQYASRMGYKVAVLSSGSQKKDFAMKLGAHEYIDSSATDPVKRLQELGGAALIVATAPNPKAIGPLTAGLAPGGKLCVLAPVGDLQVNSIDLIVGGKSVCGWPSGNQLDSEDAIDFAATHGVKCMVERFSLDDAKKASDHMLSNKVRFRSVLVME